MPEDEVGPGFRPRVTIVTPSFNQGPFIRETIESVLGQDYENVEYIVMDGGSTDETVEILRSYGDRFAWVSKPDAGQSDAIVRGFQAGTGEILAWLNADDTYAEGAVRRGVQALLDNAEVGLAYGRATITDRVGRFIEDHAFREWSLADLLRIENYIPQPATFFRRSAYDAVGGLDADLHYVMDYDLWLRLGRRHGAVAIPHVLATIRTYPEAKTSSGGMQRVVEMQRMLARHGQRRLPTRHRADFVRASMGAAREAWRAGDRAVAVRWAVHGGRTLLHPQTARQAAVFAARQLRRRAGSSR